MCEEYTDPRTGEPINFNFLPIYADPRLLIWPHTVQMYSYGDPAYVWSRCWMGGRWTRANFHRKLICNECNPQAYLWPNQL